MTTNRAQDVARTSSSERRPLGRTRRGGSRARPRWARRTGETDAQEPTIAVKTALLRRTAVKAWIAVGALGALIALLITADKRSLLAIICAWAAGLLLLGKEVLSAFARDKGLGPVKDGLEDWASICSLFGTVAAVPAVFAAIS